MEAYALVQSKNYLARILNDESTTLENFIHTCPTGKYSIKPKEIRGEVCDWVLNYLEQSNCPHQLAIAIAVGVAAHISASFNVHQFHDNDVESYPSVVASTLQKESFVCFVHVMAKFFDDSSKMQVCDLGKALPFSSSVFAIKNKRRTMEDRHVVIHDLNSMLHLEESPPHSYYAVFDGHGGLKEANYAASHLHENIVQHPDFFTDTVKAIKEAYNITDVSICDRSKHDDMKGGGCTVICALIRDKTLYLSWCGDSQGILIQKGKPKVLADPHKPDRADERKRIEDLGGFVCHIGTWRVNGALAVSRSLGDREFKPYIIAEPDVNVVNLDGSEDFLVLACDGLWDSMTSEEVTTLLYKNILDQSNEITSVNSLAEKLVHASKLQGAEDNISVIVILLRDITKIIADTKTYNISTAYMNGKSDTSINNSENEEINAQNHIIERPKDLQDITSFPSLDTDQCADDSPDHGLATSLPPEATALSELPTPPIDDITPTKEFSKLNYVEQMEQLQSHLEARGFQGTSFGEFSVKTDVDSSQKDVIDFQRELDNAADFYTTEVSSNTVFPGELSVRDATPEKAAIDMASHIINTTLETAVEKVQLVKSTSADTVSSSLNPNAEPFVMKIFNTESPGAELSGDNPPADVSHLPLQQNLLEAEDIDVHSAYNKDASLTNLQDSGKIERQLDNLKDQDILVDKMKNCSSNEEKISECLSFEKHLKDSFVTETVVDENSLNLLEAEDIDVHLTYNEDASLTNLQDSNKIERQLDNLKDQDILVDKMKIFSSNEEKNSECLSFEKDLFTEAIVDENSLNMQLVQESNVEKSEFMESGAIEQMPKLLEEHLENYLPDSNLNIEQPVEYLQKTNNIIDDQKVGEVAALMGATFQELGLVENTSDVEHSSHINNDTIIDQGLMLVSLESNQGQIQLGNSDGDIKKTEAELEDTSLKDINLLKSESGIENQLSMGDAPQQVVSENIVSPNISKQVISNDSLLPKEVQDELLKITENQPSENVIDDSQTVGVAVDLKTIPDGIPEADGVSEDVDSDSEKDGGWSYMKATAVDVPNTTVCKKSAIKTKKVVEKKTAVSLAKSKKEPPKPIKDVAAIKSKVIGGIEKTKKPQLDKKPFESKVTSTSKPAIRPVSSITVSRTKRPMTSTIAPKPFSSSVNVRSTVASRLGLASKVPSTVKSVVSTTKPVQSKSTIGSNITRPSRPMSAVSNMTTKNKPPEAIAKSNSTSAQVKPLNVAPMTSVTKTNVSRKPIPLKPATTTESKVQPIKKPIAAKKEVKDEKTVTNKLALKKASDVTTKFAHKTPLVSSTAKQNAVTSKARAQLSTKSNQNVRPIPMKYHVGLKPPSTGSEMEKSGRTKKEIAEVKKSNVLAVKPETKDITMDSSIKTIENEATEKVALEANTKENNLELTPNDSVKHAGVSVEDKHNIETPDDPVA